jgi:hypothetical protein
VVTNTADLPAETQVAIAAGDVAPLQLSQSVNADGTYAVVFSDVSGAPYARYENIYDASGVLSAQVFDNNDGSGSLILTASGLSVTLFPSDSGVTVTSDFFQMTSHANETITATGTTGDTFAFASHFGQAQLLGFAATGDHDFLDFSLAVFSYLSPAMSQAADLSALASHGAFSEANGNTAITDTFGDMVILQGVTKATLLGSPNLFAFK